MLLVFQKKEASKLGALVYTVDRIVLSKQREVELDRSCNIPLFSLFLNINAAKSHSFEPNRQIRHM